MTKTKNKSKALKTKNKNSFFRALIFGFVSCALLWIVLAFVFALVMSKQQDSNALGGVLSIVIAVVSLVTGGFVAGKCNKDGTLLVSFVLGCAFLGICYLLSTVFDLSKNMDTLTKTLAIAIALLCPVFGRGIATREKRPDRHRRKRM